MHKGLVLRHEEINIYIQHRNTGTLVENEQDTKRYGTEEDTLASHLIVETTFTKSHSI